MTTRPHAPIIPGAEPFWLPASRDLGCLLIHGFTGAPSELRTLGERLQSEGISALGVRLPGHGTSPMDLVHVGRRSWLAAAERGLDELLGYCDRVIVCGMSMGGTIALNLAARRSDPRIVGVIVMAAPVRLIDHRYRASELMGLLDRWREWGSPDIKDRTQWERHIGYRFAPVSSTIQLIRLVHETYELLPKVQQPLLVLHSQKDHTVPPINVHWLLDRVGSIDRRIIWFDESYHVLTVDVEARQVENQVLAFATQFRRPKS